jgi:hypothetical protein
MIKESNAIDEEIEFLWKKCGYSQAAYSYVLAARTRAKLWQKYDADKTVSVERRRCSFRFFQAVCMAYELSTRCRAAITWRHDLAADEGPSGDFFEFAKVFHDVLLPDNLKALTPKALAKRIEGALEQRTTDTLPKNKPGPKL